jgi:hypothetical protein
MDVMSRCSRLRKQISRYMDNDLAPDARLSLERHLASCDQCARVSESYRALQRLVRKSFAEPLKIPEVTGTQRTGPYDTKRLLFSFRNPAMRLAAMITLCVSLCAGILILSPAGRATNPPLVLEKESSQVMNTPLGALVYYEELAGPTVHAQFLQLSGEIRTSSGTGTNAGIHRISGYKSPLFCDSLSYGLE